MNIFKKKLDCSEIAFTFSLNHRSILQLPRYVSKLQGWLFQPVQFLIFCLEKHELPSQRLKLVSEKTVSMNEFRKKNGQLLYLENLKSSDFGKKGGGENPEPCPICQKSLGKM